MTAQGTLQMGGASEMVGSIDEVWSVGRGQGETVSWTQAIRGIPLSLLSLECVFCLPSPAQKLPKDTTLRQEGETI